MASVALMDARSIAATAANGGYLIGADQMDYDDKMPRYRFDDSSYRKTVYNGFGQAHPEEELRFGPNITDWPDMIALPENLIMEVASIIPDPVTTTDELIPSGDTSSYRSNPIRLSKFALSRRDPAYVGTCEKFQKLENERISGTYGPELRQIADQAAKAMELNPADLLKNTGLGTIVCSRRPGDGSAREQAASCQRVLGGVANLCVEYATKRYRSNLVNWGMIPFTCPDPAFIDNLKRGDLLCLRDIRGALERLDTEVTATILRNGQVIGEQTLMLQGLSEGETDIILAGSLINYYAQ